MDFCTWFPTTCMVGAWLKPFFVWLPGEIWAAFISVGGALIAGRIGGRMATTAALQGAEKAHKDNLARDAAASTERAVAFVQAIQAEAETLWFQVSQYILPDIDEIRTVGMLNKEYSISDDYFQVYKANASMLGLVDDREVRKAIVQAYIAAFSFVDTLRINSVLVQRVRAALGPFPRGHPQTYVMNVCAELIAYAPAVGRSSAALEDCITKFFHHTNAWLTSKGEEPTSWTAQQPLHDAYRL